MTQETQLAREHIIEQLNETLNEAGIQKVAQFLSTISNDSRYTKD